MAYDFRVSNRLAVPADLWAGFLATINAVRASLVAARSALASHGGYAAGSTRSAADAARRGAGHNGTGSLGSLLALLWPMA